jgi:hypothetical protein
MVLPSPMIRTQLPSSTTTNYSVYPDGQNVTPYMNRLLIKEMGDMPSGLHQLQAEL